MEWRPSCPKCGSRNLELEKDRRVAGIRGPHQVQLHCRTCGFILYGEKAVQEECDRQYAEYKRSGNYFEPDPPPAPEPPPPPAAEPVAATAEAPKAAPAAATPEPAPVVAEGVNMCQWAGCGKPARPRSKYCSRNCSNKNARARHAARKK